MKAILARAIVLAPLALVANTQAQTVIGLDVSPVTGWSDTCRVGASDVTSVSAPPYPLNISVGIGYLINPEPPTAFVLLGSQMATVTYHFDSPTVVDQLEIIQHLNGVSKVHGFVGDDLGSLISIGDIYSDAGDVNAPAGFTEYQSTVFDFNNTTSGRYFRFVTTELVNPAAWATYGAFPRNDDGMRIEGAVVPEPHESAMIVGFGLVALAVWRRHGTRRTGA